MRTKFILISLIALLFYATYVYAEQGNVHNEHMSAMSGHMKSETSAVVEVDNKICPVSGEKIREMGPAEQYEYNGKVYNFCCTGCIEEFKKDPEKYVKIVEGQMKGDMEKHMGQHMEMTEEGEQKGHHHMMGEKDGHMMMGMDKDKSMMKHHEETTMMDETQIKEINLEAYQFSFSPETITVNKGDKVRIHATSRDVPHGVFIKEYGINEKVEKDKPSDIEFSADKAGEFDILCSVYCGRGHKSMKAKLVVKE